MKQKQVGTLVFEFNDTAAGKIAWHIYQKARSEDMAASPCIRKGSNIIMPPGVTVRLPLPVPELPVMKLDNISLHIPSRIGNIGAINRRF